MHPSNPCSICVRLSDGGQVRRQVAAERSGYHRLACFTSSSATPPPKKTKTLDLLPEAHCGIRQIIASNHSRLRESRGKSIKTTRSSISRLAPSTNRASQLPSAQGPIQGQPAAACGARDGTCVMRCVFRRALQHVVYKGRHFQRSGALDVISLTFER